MYNPYLPCLSYFPTQNITKLEPIQQNDNAGRMLFFGCLPFYVGDIQRHGTLTLPWPGFDRQWYTNILFVDGHVKFMTASSVSWPYVFEKVY